MSERDDRPSIEFRRVDYAKARENELVANAERAGAELPGHPDLKPPVGAELEASERGGFVVALVGGQPAASGGYRAFPGDPSGQTAELVRMYVHPDNRRSGIGRALLTELEELATEDDYRYSLLRVRAEQLGAQALYEITGYRRIPDASDREGLRTFRKQLSPEAD